jgi:hypothetical protein
LSFNFLLCIMNQGDSGAFTGHNAWHACNLRRSKNTRGNNAKRNSLGKIREIAAQQGQLPISAAPSNGRYGGRTTLDKRIVR